MIRLVRIDTKKLADEKTKEMGWENDDDFKRTTGASLVGYYIDEAEYGDRLPSDAVEDEVSPIAVIVNNRLFSEKAVGWTSPKGKYAYLDEETFENLF